MAKNGIRTMLGIGFVAVLDLLTAYWARHSLVLGRTSPVLGRWVGLHLLYNTGAMLGMGARVPWLVTAIGVVGVGWLTIWAWRSPTLSRPLALMAGGALGNVLSRLIWHRVTDFITVAVYPGVFNVADVSLRVGVVWLIWGLLRRAREEPRRVEGNMD